MLELTNISHPILNAYSQATTYAVHKQKRIGRSYKGLSISQINSLKLKDRNNRAKRFNSNHNPDAIKVINWIKSLQKRSKLNDIQFAKQINISPQSLRLYKSKSGVLPNKTTMLKMIDYDKQLERERKVIIVEVVSERIG